MLSLALTLTHLVAVNGRKVRASIKCQRYIPPLSRHLTSPFEYGKVRIARKATRRAHRSAERKQNDRIYDINPSCLIRKSAWNCDSILFLGRLLRFIGCCLELDRLLRHLPFFSHYTTS